MAALLALSNHGTMTATTRIAALIAAASVAVFASVVGAQWVDLYDSTCGAVYRPDIWWGKDGCRGTMLLRTGVVVVMLGAAGVLAAVAVLRSRRSPSRSREDGPT